ncbi:MAG: cupredoxin domain-containing protein [Opitutales bacterium]|nr:cupredoxin domain-containing protein [Opitutales bacterium]MCH8541512.1 cupredoxin domain-containing protein [Opitutales bacterium]
MKSTKRLQLLSFTALLGAVVLFAGCGEPAPGGDPAEAVTSVTITGNDQMQFEPTRFVVPAGEEITLTFQNIGQMPKETMGHNLAIIRGLTPMAFSSVSQQHPENEYIAPEFEDRVIAATQVLGPGEEETIVFTAPTEPGEYPFVCSFPTHTGAGMHGIMVVQ